MDYFFEIIDDAEEYTEEDKVKAKQALDIIYKTVTDENYVFSDKLDFEYTDSEFYCDCYDDRVRLTECGLNNSDVISTAHLPMENGKPYSFFVRLAKLIITINISL